MAVTLPMTGAARERVVSLAGATLTVATTMLPSPAMPCGVAASRRVRSRTAGRCAAASAASVVDAPERHRRPP